MRPSIIMPTGTKWNSTVSIAPVQIYTDTIGAVFISGTVTVNVVSGATVAALDCSDVGSAQRMVEQVNSVVKSGSGVAAPVVVADTPTPSVPTGLAAVTSGADIAVTWNAVSGAAGYILSRSANGTDYVQIYNGATNSFTDAGVSGAGYYYKVLAYTVAAQSALSSAVQYMAPTALIPAMTSDSAPSGNASAISEPSRLEAWRAFSSVPSDEWYYIAGGGTGWIQYQFGAGNTITGYEFNNNSGANTICSFILAGSNNGSSWTTLDTQSGVSILNGAQFRAYVLNAASYTYYRITFSASTNGVAAMSLCQLYGY